MAVGIGEICVRRKPPKGGDADMYVCLSCGNSRSFEINTWLPVTIESLAGPIHVAADVDPVNCGISVRCPECSDSSVWNVLQSTPRQLLNEIAYRHFRKIRCPVQAARQAKEWFREHAPHLAFWLEDEVVQDVMVSSDVFWQIPSPDGTANERRAEIVRTPFDSDTD